MHVSNKVAFHLSDSFFDAIESVDIVALEINPDTWMKMMTSDPYVAEKMGGLFSSNQDYRSKSIYAAMFELKQPTNKKIGQALASELGILNSLLYRTNNYKADFQEDTYLDLFIYQTGKKLGKEVTGLERLGETMILNEYAAKPIDDREERKRQKQILERKRFLLTKMLNGENFSEVMENAYRKGDLDMLDSLSRLSSGNELYHKLIIEYRNLGMAHAMDSIMQIKPLFAGVGAAHLPNSYGMVNLLRQKGYTVTSVLQNKSNNGADRKEKIEGIFLDNKFNKTTSYDGVVNFKLPGTFFEFPESDGVKLGVYPDMANGARYLVTRISTFAPLYGLTPNEYSSKIDSLLFENIPGKIIKKEFESVEEGERISILSKTKKGDFEKYLIHISPIEVAIFKVGGKKEFVKRNDASSFISSATYKKTNNHWSRFTPENNAYSVLLPGLIVHEVENNAFMPDYASKSVQSVSDSNGYFLVLNRSYGDMDFMEEDSFELRQFAQSFYKQFNYNISSAKQTIFKDYSAIKVIGEYSGETRTHEQMAELHAMILCVGKQYYLLAAQTSNLKAVDQFFNSFELKAFEYNQPFKKQYDTARLFSTLTTVTPPVENGY